MNWTTGAGTARYWVLKLLIDEFEIGSVESLPQLYYSHDEYNDRDQLFETTVPGVATSPFCGVDNGEADGYGNVSLQCADSSVMCHHRS